MRITRDITLMGLRECGVRRVASKPRYVRQPGNDPRAWIVVACWLILAALTAWITPYRPLRWELAPTIIHLRTQEPLEVQTELARWAMQPGVRKASSHRQADGTTEIVLIAARK